MTVRTLLVSCVLLGLACGDDSSAVDASRDADSGDATRADASLPDGAMDSAMDADVPDGSPADATTDGGPEEWDWGPPIEGCEPGPVGDGMVRLCIPFSTGVRVHVVADVEHSFGSRPPPADAELDSNYAPRAGECSVATHDRYWVRASDGFVYRTWHPPSTVDVETGEACHFGHEHGDDPRTSPLYHWAGGVPFGMVNRAAASLGVMRHEDHFGHKVVVQNLWEGIVGNGPSDDPMSPAGFDCYWLSKVHQGTHSGDALGNNLHEYQNSVICDDGHSRHPDSGREERSGADDHTENSVKTLTVWGGPGWFKACSGLERVDSPGSGREPPDDSDTNREIKCARVNEGWTFKEFPREILSATGHPDFAPRDAGIDELWKPWMTVVDRDGNTAFTSSAYYVVRNPVRLYNDGSLVAQRDVDGDGIIDTWIPTLEACLAFALGERRGQCADLPIFPEGLPLTEWWRSELSPFNGTIRVIHPKTISMNNRSGRTEMCTDAFGQESDADPLPATTAGPRCPAGQLFQRVAATENLWGYGASWGDARVPGNIAGSRVNARSDSQPAGYGHEWVRFFDAPGVHAPN